jgi:hypothetical protein
LPTTTSFFTLFVLLRILDLDREPFVIGFLRNRIEGALPHLIGAGLHKAERREHWAGRDDFGDAQSQTWHPSAPGYWSDFVVLF